ncbi:MAG: hypothetical protein NC303_01090 [Firmicutes bacterium]|nr:hypothetical protein [Bacillota bacterium]
MVKRQYLIVFGFGTLNDNKFTTIQGENKDIAYGSACAKYGFANVGGVYVDNAQNREYLQAKGYVEI